MNYQAKLHIKEKATDAVYGRQFEGWMSGGAMNVFGSLAGTHCAMNSTQAIAYRVAVEKRAFEWNTAAKITEQGEPSDSTVTVEYCPEFLS